MSENEPRDPQTTPESTPVTGSAPQSPVPVARVRSQRRFDARWGIALVVVALVAGAAFVGARLLTSPAAATGLANWAPADSIMYVEGRVDSLGEQGRELGAFLGHFPALGDMSNVDARLAEVYDGLLGSVTDGEFDYSSQIRPWFAGSVALAMTRFPSMDEPELSPQGVLVIASIKDRAAASAWLDKVFAESPTAPSKTTRGNAELVTLDEATVAVLPDVLLVGDTPSVTAAIDRGGANGLATSPNFSTASAALDADRLGSLYMDGRRYMEWVLTYADDATGATTCPAVLEAIPAWMAGSFRADDTALVARGAAAHSTSTGFATSNAKSALLSHLPASTLAVLNAHEFGRLIKTNVDQVRECGDDATAEMFQQLDSGVAALGGWDALVGPFGETAFVLDRIGQMPSGGIAFVPTDRAAAERLVAQAEGFLAMAGESVTVTEETYAGQTLKIIGAADPEMAMGLRLAIVVTDEIAAVGMESWVKSVLDTEAGSSLANDARFTGALGRVDAEHASLVYVNINGIREMIEGLLPPDAAGEYQDKVRPWLEPFDTFITTSTVGDDVDRTNTVITVK